MKGKKMIDDRAAFFEASKKNAKFELLKIEDEKKNLLKYKQGLISDILKVSKKWKKSDLIHFSIKRLEMIFDNA